ncbi:MAG TPA: ABC transporter permease [Steroidobacteraceae bacterium]|nr:ABC transporter permease [Steroidobacteraceae bacterium]
MNTLGTIVGKELRETVRDRRTMLSALLLGPLFGPVLFAIMISLTLDRAVGELDRTIEVAVGGAEHAPNLLAFLEENGIATLAGPGNEDQARVSVEDRVHDLVLLVPPEYGDALLDGKPAPLALVYDGSDTEIARDATRVRAVLQAYAQRLAALRLQARGVDPNLIAPLAVQAVDVATPAGRSVLLLGMITYFLLFSTLMGGLYLAIDSTAGERERGSLESLLTLPVSRTMLITGKMLATCCMMAIALAVTLAAFTFSLGQVRLEQLGMATHFGPATALSVFAIVLPFIPLGAALMTVVASFTRSYKEAQTWLTVVLLIPTVPILFAGIYGLRATTSLMLVPSLGQHLLITSLMKGETPASADLAISAGATLAVGLLLGWIATRLYRREGILG